MAQRDLLGIARAALEQATAGAPPSAPDYDPSRADLSAPRGAFVTLHRADGSVRGCVGTTAMRRPVAEIVAEMARASALSDPRFDRVQRSEADTLSIEISVLDVPTIVDGLDAVMIGRDGLIVEGQGRRGLLLPQVASSRDWTPLEFVQQTCIKAGLPQDAYLSPDVQVSRFSALVFHEPTLKVK